MGGWLDAPSVQVLDGVEIPLLVDYKDWELIHTMPAFIARDVDNSIVDSFESQINVAPPGSVAGS